MTNEERLKFAEMYLRESYLGGYDNASRLTQALAYADQNENARLYRYRPVNMYSLEVFLFGYIYAGSASRFNDPVDCMPVVDRKDLLPLYRSMYPECEQSGNDVIVMLNEMVENKEQWYRNAFHVACLSEEYDNELMWFHYANCHKCFVLAYHIQQDLSDKVTQNLYPVIYTNKPLSVCKDAIVVVVQNCHADIAAIPEKALKTNYWCTMTAPFKRGSRNNHSVFILKTIRLHKTHLRYRHICIYYEKNC